MAYLVSFLYQTNSGDQDIAGRYIVSQPCLPTAWLVGVFAAVITEAGFEDDDIKNAVFTKVRARNYSCRAM